MSLITESEELKQLIGVRESLATQQMELQRKIADANKVFAMRLTRSDFLIATAKLRPLKAEITDCNMKLREVGIKIRELRGQTELGVSDRQYFVSRLSEVRDKWQDVAAADCDHGPSERLLAAQFVRDLTPIIKKLIG